MATAEQLLQIYDTLVEHCSEPYTIYISPERHQFFVVTLALASMFPHYDTRRKRKCVTRRIARQRHTVKKRLERAYALNYPTLETRHG